LRVVVNFAPCSCAFYALCSSGHTLWFGGRHGYNQGNYASASVIAHEYGHYVKVAFSVPASSPPFAEGYADSLSIVLNDDPVIGREHVGFTTHVRDDPRVADCKYPIVPASPAPCSCTAHAAGQVLSGVWTRVMDEFKARYGTEDGLELTRQLFVDWTLVTLGGEDNCNGAYYGTVVELEEVVAEAGIHDPDWQVVCNALLAHDLDCTY
jgi:hypothetical protein